MSPFRSKVHSHKGDGGERASLVPLTHDDRLAHDRLVYGEHFDEWENGVRRCLPWAEGRRRADGATRIGLDG